MTRPRRREAGMYELTLHGALGPALRRRLSRCPTVSCEMHTVVRIKVSSDRDLVDVVQFLRSRELDIAEVVVVA